MIVTTIVAVVGAIIMQPLTVSQRVQTRDANYAAAQQDVRTGVDSMVSQVRQATSLIYSSGNAIDMNVTLNGTALRVYYECDIPQPGSLIYRECVRVQAAAGNSLPSPSTAVVVVRNLLNGTSSNPVFSFGPNPVAPYYMSATVDVPASGGITAFGGLNHTIALSDGALMRNLNVGN